MPLRASAFIEAAQISRETGLWAYTESQFKQASSQWMSLRLKSECPAMSARFVTILSSVLLTSLNSGASTDRSQSSANFTQLPGFTPPEVSQYRLTSGLSYEVGLWGKVRRKAEAARASLAATIEAREASLEIARSRHAGGIAGESDVTRASSWLGAPSSRLRGIGSSLRSSS